MGGLKIQVSFPEIEVEEFKRDYAEWMKDESIDQKIKTDSNFVRVYYMNRVALRRGAPIGNQNASLKVDAETPVSQSLKTDRAPHGQDLKELKSEADNRGLVVSLDPEISIRRESQARVSDDLEAVEDAVAATGRELSKSYLG